jgi:hypothetical protein
VPGPEVALEGLLDRGVLRVLALFDKPDPLDGPFFEETVYVTPSIAPDDTQDAIVAAVTRAAAALGLHHGPIHAECRVALTDSAQQSDVFVLEVAARPIGGLCARALRFRSDIADPDSEISLEELLLRQALGEDPAPFRREPSSSGVMMIPIPRRGIFRGVDGIAAARAVPRIDDLHITAKPDQLLVPLPEGASYLGFVFARGVQPADTETALREAHARLVFTIEPELPLLTSSQLHYNRPHG